jgi:hypothetical protein
MKSYNRSCTEDRTMSYRLWRRTLDGPYVMDLDQIEYTYKNGVPEPVACLELTRTDDADVGQPYLDAILTRYDIDAQGEAVTAFAERLGCKAAIVLFNSQITKLWVYNLTDKAGWWAMDQAKYRHWIKSLS